MIQFKKLNSNFCIAIYVWNGDKLAVYKSVVWIFEADLIKGCLFRTKPTVQPKLIE